MKLRVIKPFGPDEKTYNGVALITRQRGHDIETNFPNWPDEQKRLLAATVGGVRIINVYVPNGQSVRSENMNIN